MEKQALPLRRGSFQWEGNLMQKLWLILVVILCGCLIIYKMILTLDSMVCHISANVHIVALQYDFFNCRASPTGKKSSVWFPFHVVYSRVRCVCWYLQLSVERWGTRTKSSVSLDEFLLLVLPADSLDSCRKLGGPSGGDDRPSSANVCMSGRDWVHRHRQTDINCYITFLFHPLVYQPSSHLLGPVQPPAPLTLSRLTFSSPLLLTVFLFSPILLTIPCQLTASDCLTLWRRQD